MEARTWTQPLGPALTPPDPFLHVRLRLTDVWQVEGGEWRALADLSTVALWSILGYLRWHAPHLLRVDPAGAAHRDPDGYLLSRPFVRAIDAELAGRAEIPSGEALACLRAMGAAPWELPPLTRPQRRSRPADR